jgi:benzoate membrane transport protein
MEISARLSGVARRTPGARSVLADINSHNLTAGLTTAMMYTFAATPVLFEATARLGLSHQAAVSWYVATFLTSAISGLVLSIKYAMPLPVGWTIPGIVFLSTAGVGRSHGELTAAVMLAGVVMILLSLFGITERLMRWLPLPVVMGVFAGSVLKYATGIFDHMAAQPTAVGAAVGGYLAARAVGIKWLPPMAGAFAASLVAVALTGTASTQSVSLGVPMLVPVRPEFTAAAVISLALPLIVISVAMGNVQGFGVLMSQGYRPPIGVVTRLMGVTTIINALFGGHTSTLQSQGTALLAGNEAGPKENRYVANVVASVIAIGLAAGAASVGALLGLLPPGLVPALAGLALLGTLIEAMRTTVVSDFPVGGFFAFAIAASSFDILGIAPAFWGLIGGMVVVLVLELPACRQLWANT